MKYLLLTFVLLVPVEAMAQVSLTDQINAVSAAQDEYVADEKAAHEAYARQETQRRKAVAAAQAQRQAEADALKEQKRVEAAADKKRDQDYQDELRKLDVQGKSLRIEAEKARVARQNEYIDQELNSRAAETDVVKSVAQSNRDLSSGTKTLLEKTGEAAVKGQLK